MNVECVLRSLVRWSYICGLIQESDHMLVNFVINAFPSRVTCVVICLHTRVRNLINVGRAGELSTIPATWLGILRKSIFEGAISGLVIWYFKETRERRTAQSERTA